MAPEMLLRRLGDVSRSEARSAISPTMRGGDASMKPDVWSCRITKRLVAVLILVLAIADVSFAQLRLESTTKKFNVAIFVFPGVQVIDMAGPYEVFAESGMNVYTVAETITPVQAAGGLTITPKYSFENAPKADLLVLPGGGFYKPGDKAVGDQMVNPVAMKWIKETAAQTQVLTVCNGAFLAAKAGLLENLPATTFWGYLDHLTEVSPTTTVVYDKKYVDNGRIVTTAGLSSGIDGALHVVSKLLGNGRAQFTALNMEYNWDPDSKFARGMLPDMNIPDEIGDSLPDGSYLAEYSGNRDHWNMTVRVPGPETASQIIQGVNTSLTKWGKWSKVEAPANESRWTFIDRLGAKWFTVITVGPDGSDLLLKLQLHRS
jgi:putative intracellular protease/amidase